VADLPSGTVTFLVTDIEGSTQLVERFPERYADVLDAGRAILRGAVSEFGGREVDCRADELFAAFPQAQAAVGAAVAAQNTLAAHRWPGGVVVRVRMGIHTGEPTLHDDGYLGLDVHRAVRICAAAHGGQVLVSQSARDLLRRDVKSLDLGAHVLKGISQPERLHQLVAKGLQEAFPPTRRQAESAFAGDEPALAAAARRLVGGGDRLRRALVSRRTQARGLADLGWQVRSLLPSAPPERRVELAELGGELFTAARSLVDAERCLDEVDRRGLQRRLSDYRELAVISQRAKGEVTRHEQALRDIDELRRLAELGRSSQVDLAQSVSSLAWSPEHIGALRESVRALSRQLDAALSRVRTDSTPTMARLRRTRFRGIYRHGNRFVVPYWDETGVERRRAFEVSHEARDFRRNIRRAEKAQVEHRGSGYPDDHLGTTNVSLGEGGGH
jgi:class 3 adenylate cyclase